MIGFALAFSLSVIWWTLWAFGARLGWLGNIGCPAALVAVIVASIARKRPFVAVGLLTAVAVPALALFTCAQVFVYG